MKGTDVTYHLVDGYGGESWCGKPWHDVLGAATLSAIHMVNCQGCKDYYNTKTKRGATDGRIV